MVGKTVQAVFNFLERNIKIPAFETIKGMLIHVLFTEGKGGTRR